MKAVYILLIVTVFSYESKWINKQIDDSIKLERADLIVFSFNQREIRSVLHKNFLDSIYIMMCKSRGIDVPVRKYIYSFINTRNDTMRIESYLGWSKDLNYYFDNIPFKKGHYVLDEILNLDHKKLKGKDLFEENPHVRKMKIKYLPYGIFEGETKQMKNITFSYYQIKEEDLIPMEKKE